MEEDITGRWSLIAFDWNNLKTLKALQVSGILYLVTLYPS